MKRLSFLILVILTSIAVNAQTISSADAAILDKIKQANDKHTSIVSNFKQLKHMPILGENILSNGKFHYNRPEQLAMVYENPKGDLLLISNDKMTMVASGKRREASTKSNAKMRGMKNILASFIQGNIQQAGADKISIKETQNLYIVTAEIGKANKSNISKATAQYDKSDLTITLLNLEESDGTYTVYELVGKQLNKLIDQSIFQAPKK
ncbi:MAG: outer membrane lipoprotein carrier protein LolA [Prevotellaceae bacterium]|jgi:outer membrane lipoprotein-sorting protein|nr:outer membrane lipoprotein carrier protein LolA [Prevotellaceae bacterium]